MSPKQELQTGQDMLERFATEMKDRMLSPEEELYLEEEMDLDVITKKEDKKDITLICISHPFQGTYLGITRSEMCQVFFYLTNNNMMR